MSNSTLWQPSCAYVTMAFLILMLLYSPLKAGSLSGGSGQSSESLTDLLTMSSIVPSAQDALTLREFWARKSHSPQKLNQARTVLEDLRNFADAAQRAIRMGQRIRKLRRDNQRLKQSIAAYEKNDHYLERQLVKVEAETSHLTKIVVANWIATFRLKDQDRSDYNRLILAKDGLTESEEHLALLHKQANARNNKVRNLRAKSAALAAEIGRMRRQIIISNEETRQIEDKSQAIEMAIRELRYAVSARLRALLSEN